MQITNQLSHRTVNHEQISLLCANTKYVATNVQKKPMQRYTLYLPTIKKSKTGATDITNFCDTDMLSITSLWKAEKEVFYFITNICLVQSCYSSLQTLMWDADEPYFISWQIFVIKFKSHDMYIVLYDKYLWDAGQVANISRSTQVTLRNGRVRHHKAAHGHDAEEMHSE